MCDFVHFPLKKATQAPKVKSRFKVLEVDEEDCEVCGYDEVMHIRTVTDSGSRRGQSIEMGWTRTRRGAVYPGGE